jgi:hypothetical protein
LGLQVGPAFFAFSHLPFAAKLRVAEPLSIGRYNLIDHWN